MLLVMIAVLNLWLIVFAESAVVVVVPPVSEESGWSVGSLL